MMKSRHFAKLTRIRGGCSNSPMRPQDAAAKIVELSPLLNADLMRARLAEAPKTSQLGGRIGVPGRRSRGPRRAHPRVTGGEMAERTCSIDGCEKPHLARGFCKKHYRQWRKSTDLLPSPPPCLIEGCLRLKGENRQGWCDLHYHRWKRHGDPLMVILPDGRRSRWPDRTAEERFWERVNLHGPAPDARPDLGPCWLWMAWLDRQGYGWFGDIGAHRFSWELSNGAAIPDGLQIDHLCFVRNCVNPWHLEAVTPWVNTMRSASWGARNASKTHCPAGHPYSGDNLILENDGRRKCRSCRTARDRVRYPAKYEAFKRRLSAAT